MKIRVKPTDQYYQVLLERCIETMPNELWDVYSDGELWIDEYELNHEQDRAEHLYGSAS